MFYILSRYSIFLLWLGYVTFVVYGSLVPLQFTPRPLEGAWAAFLQSPFLQLGMEGRADWVANGVLYVPVGFLTAVLLAGVSGRGGRWLAYGAAVAFGFGLAIVVEFAQLFFPPRTVSLNDLLAEGIGAGLGVALAVGLAGWFRALLGSLGALLDSGRARWLLQAYIAAYLAFALFPFDFLISWSEIEFKAYTPLWGWWAAPAGTTGVFFILRLAVEVVLTLPIGWALAARGQRSGIGLGGAGVLGFLFGTVIEVAQFFLASGMSQGVSVLTRTLGVMLGLASWRHRADLAGYLRGTPGAFKGGLALLYAAVLLTANGWFSGQWVGSTGTAVRLAEVHFLPFYYHYFTTEAKALHSLVSISLMYAPLGILVWLGGGRGRLAAVLGAAVAALVEAGKLFLAGTHPDPTNLLIAAVASGLAVALAQCLTQPAGVANGTSAEVVAAEDSTLAADNGTLEMHPSRHRKHQRTSPLTGRSGQLAIGLASVSPLILSWLLVSFPIAPVALGLVIAVAATVVWYRPAWIFVIVPAALPVFDLAPWSGRFFLDEFDLLLLALIPVAYLRTSPGNHRADMPLVLAISLLVVSITVSMAIGIGLPQWPDANAFNNYYSPYNALRIARGFVWALLLLGLARRLRRDGEADPVRPALTWGMTLGLGVTVAVVLWERVTFSGLFNFDTGYRVTGPFSAIHTGGAYIECFLAAGVPFLVVLLLVQRNLLLRLAGTGLLVAATYALMVTYSRNGYSAYLVALGVVFFFALFARELRWKRFVLPVVLGVVVLGAALPVFVGGFAQERVALIGQDIGVRYAHWTDSLNMRDDSLVASLFGMGIGRFPETAFWRSRGQNRHAFYRLETEGSNVFLRLTPGESLYMEQFVSLQPQTAYVLKLDLRARSSETSFTVPICQKWMLTSYDCVWNSMLVGGIPETWIHHEIHFNSGVVGGGPWYARRPVKLSLYNGNPKATVDVDNVSLEPVGGGNILENGDFTRQLDHWFFSTDSHLQWHTKSLPVGALFDQGWLGLASWSLLLGLAMIRLVGTARRGDLPAAAIAGSIAGILVIGLFDTVIDAPRFLLLLVLLAGIGAMKSPRISAP